MSPREPKAAEWLRQQIDELGALRNASVRDPQFKAWRQNTLTFIQRIWPGDTSKSERFRRVPFTPPSTRHDARTGREYYERGCGEALEYLSSLLAQIGNEPAAEAVEPERHPESFEGDFPEIDLGGSPARPVGAAPPAAFDERPATPAPTAENARGQGPPELPASAGRPTSPGSSGDFLASAAFLDPEATAPGNLPVEGRTRFGTPSPPRLPEPPARPNEGASRISVRGNTPPAEPRGNPLENFLQRSESEESARQDAARHDDARKDAAPAPKNGKHKKGKTPKPRLKDMLGLSSLEQETHPSPEAPPAIPREASKIEVRRERSQVPPPAAAPPPPAPSEPPAADDSPAFHRGVESSGGWSLPEFLTPDETMPLPAPEPPAGLAPPAAPEAPAREGEMLRPEPREEDAGDTARVTAEFLSKSPVLSSLPRPVNRRAPEGTDLGPPARGPHGPVASQILAIAAEVDSLGVPEGHRARARATLLDLSRQLDDGGIAWDVLRDAIHFVMEFPPLARRVLPLLLPFLDLAA